MTLWTLKLSDDRNDLNFELPIDLEDAVALPRDSRWLGAAMRGLRYAINRSKSRETDFHRFHRETRTYWSVRSVVPASNDLVRRSPTPFHASVLLRDASSSVKFHCLIEGTRTSYLLSSLRTDLAPNSNNKMKNTKKRRNLCHPKFHRRVGVFVGCILILVTNRAEDRWEHDVSITYIENEIYNKSLKYEKPGLRYFNLVPVYFPLPSGQPRLRSYRLEEHPAN